MSLRVTKVAQVPFLSIGAKLTEKQEEMKRKDLILEFKKLCKYSNDLKASYLDTQLINTSNGLFLEYYLNETEQSYLNLQNGTRTTSLSSNDMFANDVTSITQELSRCRELIRTAINPAISLDMLREKSTLGDQIRFIRRRLRKREIFYLPTNGNELLAIPHVTTKYYGPSVRVRVNATVCALFKRNVELRDSKMIGDIPENLIGVKLPKVILMSRLSVNKDRENFLRIAGFLDSVRKIEVLVGVNLDWINGRANSLRFLGF